MKKEIICPFCKNNKWIISKTFPITKKCATPNCEGLHPEIIDKLNDIPGIIFEKD